MNVYEIVTEKIIKELENGVVPWKKPWTAGGWPKNLVSGKEYRGINVWLLASNHYASPWYLTYKQANDLGGHVKKGEKGSMVVFFKMLDTHEKNKDGIEKVIPMLRYYTVFSSSQCEGIVTPSQDTNAPVLPPIAAAQALVDGYIGPKVEHGRDKACYRPSTDTVWMPNQEAFASQEAYYSTIFHELTHSTGHKNRLNRRLDEDFEFGDHAYTKEELIAETGAAFLCAHAGISPETLPQSVAYLSHWIANIKADSRMIVQAASGAQKAADLIRGISVEKQQPEVVAA